jgi:hypothetical protein
MPRGSLSLDYTSFPANSTTQDAWLQIYCKFQGKSIIHQFMARPMKIGSLVRLNEKGSDHLKNFFGIVTGLYDPWIVIAETFSTVSFKL